MVEFRVTAAEALKRLQAGNALYCSRSEGSYDCSPTLLDRLCSCGQAPYAIIVGCSDSRVIPEAVFSANPGDLFVIRVAGNVIDDHQLGSIEYAAEHLGTGLVVVLGHDHCGAVDAAINHSPDGYIKYITDDILEAIGTETDEVTACCLNAKHSCMKIESSLQIRRDEAEYGLRVIPAVYHLADGRVEFL